MRKAATAVWDGVGPAAWALWPASVLYAAGWNTYELMYAWGLRRRVSYPSVCIGNLTVGGTGKTPMTLWMHGLLQELGFRVVVSVSGYGSPHVKGATVAPNGPLAPAEWGDEAALIRWRLPETPLIVGRKRALAAGLCDSRFPGSIMLMDDGMQHLAFKPSVTIALDPDRPNTFCLPAGPYREPRTKGRRKASLVLPGQYRLLDSGTQLEPQAVPTEADLLCAVGSPQRLIAGVEKLGVKLVQVRVEADHDPLDRPDLLDGLGGTRPLIVTSKDWVKLSGRSDLGERAVVVADYEVRVEPEQAFADWLRNELSEYVDATSR